MPICKRGARRCIVKKIAVIIFAVFVLSAAMLSGCVWTNFAVGGVLRIETVWNEGFAPFARDFVRVFDFETGKVTDTLVADEADIPEGDSSSYNKPKSVAKFTAGQAEQFTEKLNRLGFFNWEENYVAEGVFDASGYNVNVYFADGTVKCTYIYGCQPPRYEEVKKAFSDFLGAGLYYAF